MRKRHLKFSYIAFAMALCISAQAAIAKQARHSQSFNASEKTAILVPALLYCFGNSDPKSKPWIVIVSPRIDGEKRLSQALEAHGMQRASQSSLESLSSPAQYFHIEVAKLDRLTQNRARVRTVEDFLLGDLQHGAQATVYLNRKGNRWIVDTEKSMVSVGD